MIRPAKSKSLSGRDLLGVIWTNLYRIRRRVLRGFRKAFLGEKAPSGRTPGTPPDLPFSTLAGVAREELKKDLVSVAHRHISGWKTSGAYRLFLEYSDGGSDTLVYKNARYGQAEIPGLKDFPALPGVPEYVVYAQQHPSLVRYQPRVFVCRELVAGQHYQYIFEDIRPGYERVASEAQRMAAVEQLGDLHQAMAEAFSDGPPEKRHPLLLVYDHAFTLGIIQYAGRVLREYANVSQNPNLAEVLARWPEIERLLSKEDVHRSFPLRPIHGDLNFANVFLHKRKPGNVKILDWEWAGYGLVLSDLAALSKGISPEMEQRALQIYLPSLPGYELSEVRYAFYWCLLERSLNDAAFLAAHELSGKNKTRTDITRIIDVSLRRMVYACEKL
jgi:aminoglycoside phosphotransferase (APT) family kinase protein